MSLKEYNKKRNFNNTKEPIGTKQKSSIRRFVIQYHEARTKHYDFRLEHNGVLLSFAVPKGLSMNPKDKRLAVMVEDHPIDYINFEGIIPKGNYGAGTVEIYDKGEYIPLDNIDQGLKKGLLKFILNGNKFKGEWSLINTEENKWLIIKGEDEYSSKGIKKKKTKIPFKNCSIQLATLTNSLPKGKDYIYEIKYDGYRIIAYVENKKVKLLSRNNNDYTNKFQNLSKSLKEIEQDSFVLDGEVVAFDSKGKSDFGLLQESIKNNENRLYYVAFDLLYLNGQDLRTLPLIERKNKLERLLFKSNDYLIYSQHVDKGKECFEFAKENNLEGIIAKRIDSKYLGRRTNDWLKIKCYLRQEFVIGGYSTSSKNELISALFLGYYDDKKLIYVGKVGTGFSENIKKELYLLFQKNIRKTSPFFKKIEENNAIWLRPIFVAEIQFTEFTKDKLLRQPSFIGLRKDKNAKEVFLEYKNEKDKNN